MTVMWVEREVVLCLDSVRKLLLQISLSRIVGVHAFVFLSPAFRSRVWGSAVISEAFCGFPPSLRADFGLMLYLIETIDYVVE
jgi:hypothetical protein